MADNLETIDQALEEVEEQLLADLRGVRKEGSEDTYIEVDAGTRAALAEVNDSLRHQLDHSGDTVNLSLQTDQHENLYARMKVVGNLLHRTIPATFLDIAHQEAKQARLKLEKKVTAKRKEDKQEKREAPKADKPKGLLGKLFKKPAAEKARNTSNVTAEEEAEFEETEEHTYQDKGVYSASRELAILAEQVLLHHVEGQSIEEVVKERAEFLSRDLSNAPIEAKKKRDIAQTPEEIRRKLNQRDGAGAAGASKFAARDLSTSQPKSKEVAQSPDEIRRKLAERGAKQESGASRFEAKDLSNTTQTFVAATPPPPKKAEKEIAQTPEEIRRKLAERQGASGGKAVFGAKDVESVADKFPAKEETKEKETQKPAASKSAGKAIFEAKDLSDPPPDKS